MTDNRETLLNVVDRARGWIANGGPIRYDLSEAKAELEKAVRMIDNRIALADADAPGERMIGGDHEIAEQYQSDPARSIHDTRGDAPIPRASRKDS